MDRTVFNREEINTPVDLAAYIISGVFYPIFSSAAGLASVIYFYSAGSIVYWLSIGILTSAAPTLVHMLYKRYSKGSKLERKDRNTLYISGTFALLLTYSIYYTLNAPILLQNIVLGSVIGSLIFAAINSRFKISVHAGCVAGAAALNLYTPLMPFFAVSTLLTSWSRLKLNRHTLKQVVAGIIMGLTIGSLVLALSS